MKTYWLIAKNRLITFPKRMYGIVLLFLLAITLLTGRYLLENPYQSGQLPIAVVDLDNSLISKKVIDRLKENDMLLVIETDDPQRSLSRMDIDAYFVIKEGFSKRVNDLDIIHSLDIHYLKGNVSIQVTMEIILKEIMRLFIDEMGFQYIIRIYADYGYDFSKNDAVNAQQYIDDIWARGGLTIPVVHKYVDSATITADNTPHIRNLIIQSLMVFMIFILVFCLGSDYVRQKEQGVLHRLKLNKVNISGYLLTLSIIDVIPYLLIPFLILGIKGMYFALLFLGAALVNAIMAIFIRRTSDFLFTALTLAAIISLAEILLGSVWY